MKSTNAKVLAVFSYPLEKFLDDPDFDHEVVELTEGFGKEVGSGAGFGLREIEVEIPSDKISEVSESAMAKQIQVEFLDDLGEEPV